MRKDSAIVIRPGLARREQELSSRLDVLLGKHKDLDATIEDGSELTDFVGGSADVLADSEAVESAQLAVPENVLDSVLMPPPDHKAAPSRRSASKKTAQLLYDNWVALLPTLEGEYLYYMQRAQGRLDQPLQGEPHRCITGRCVTEAFAVQCLYANRGFFAVHRNLIAEFITMLIDIVTTTFETCECTTLPQTLIRNGLFPTSPTHPRSAISIDLLDLYFALFERSADAVSALAGALKTMYYRRGFSILNGKVSRASCHGVLAVFLMMEFRENQFKTLSAVELAKRSNGTILSVSNWRLWWNRRSTTPTPA